MHLCKRVFDWFEILHLVVLSIAINNHLLDRRTEVCQDKKDRRGNVSCIQWGGGGMDIQSIEGASSETSICP